MRILFFSPYYYPYISGLTMYPYRIIEHLKNKHHITVLTFQKPSTKKQNFSDRKIKIHYMPYLFTFSKGFISPQSLFFFAKELSLHDVVFLNLPSVEGLFLALYARFLHKKIISLFHCNVILSHKNPIHYIVEKVLKIATSIQMKLSDKIISNEDYFKNQQFPKSLKKKAVYTLPPIIYHSKNKKYANKLKKIKGNKVWIGFAGRIASEKGIEYLIDAASNIENCELVFAGPGKTTAGEKNYFQKIREKLKQSRICFHMFERVTNSELTSLFKTIDILVLPSINQTEAFGMVQAEAMLSGTPVIATNLPGVRIPIRLTKMGILIPPKNVKQMTKAIKEILKNKSKYANNTLTANAKRIFSITRTYSFYDKLFAE